MTATVAGKITLAQALVDRAAARPQRIALVTPEGSLTYAQLEKQSAALALGLLELGIGEGARAVVLLKPGLDFVRASFALLRIGAVPVFVDPGIGWKNLGQCLAEADPFAFIGINRAHLARILFRWAHKSLDVTVSPDRSILASHSLREIVQTREGSLPDGHIDLDQAAAIAFTSGSTGVPKGVVYTHGMLSSQVELLRNEYGIEEGEVDLATFPLFALFDPGLGVTTIFPEMDFSRPGDVDPEQIIQSIKNNQVTHMFGSPALLYRVGAYCVAHGVKFPSLKRVLSAGAPVSDELLLRFSQLLDGSADVFTPYGATEALPVCSISARQRLALSQGQSYQGVCVGRALENIDLTIIRIDDGPLPYLTSDLLVPDGEVGEVVVRGDNVSPSYFSRPDANRLSKMRDADGSLWHRMGDLGYLDDQRRLWFCGRKSHRVRTAERVLFTVPCERIFNRHPDVFRTALVGTGQAGQQQPVLCVELRPGVEFGRRQRIRKELLQIAGESEMTAEIKTVLFHSGFPVDIRHNAKIFREKLAVWANKNLS